MLLIYTPHITPRIQYIMQYVFEEQFGLTYEIINDEEEFIRKNSEQKIIYARKNIEDGIYFFCCDLLFETNIHELDINSGQISNNIVLFKHFEKDALGFDVFAAVFYLISRYEEYLQRPTDKFGNYDFKNSILNGLNCMHIPVVEQWMNMLKEVLVEKFPSLQFKQATTKFALSFDVDVAYAYRNRSLVRTIGGIIKKIISLNFSDFTRQILTIFHVRKDMFDTYQYIFSKIKNTKAIFFFNMGRYSRYDKNPSYKNKAFRKLIKKIHVNSLTGLHPSYKSNSNLTLLASEKNWLEEIVGEKLICSRQHYLKLKLPDTYNTLIANRIENDFTIGYHDAYGFRAGTCKPFLFFNLKTNQTTNLRLFPFAIMEGTLNDVLKLSIEESKKIISDLIITASEYKGVFIPIWHNSTLSDKDEWKGWRKVFEHMLLEIEKRKLMNLFN